jgi:HSP20 family protein
MAITIWNELADMERRMDEFFKEASWPRAFLAPATGKLDRFLPAADVFHRAGDLVVRAELPGIDPLKDVKVTLVEGDLCICGERKAESELTEKDYFRKERTYGSFERHIAVPEDLDPAKVSASYKDGVLEVLIKGGGKPAPAVKPREIEVKVKPAK